MFIRPTIGVKLILSVSLLVISLAVVLSSFFVCKQKAIIENELRNRGISLAENLAYNSEYGLLLENKEMLYKLIAGVIKNDDIAFVVVCDQNGKIIASIANSTLWIEFLKGIRTTHSTINQYSFKGKGVYDIIAPVSTVRGINKGEDIIFDSQIGQTKSQENIGFVRVGVLLENKEKTVKNIQMIAFFISLLVIMVGIVWTVLLTRRITQPIKQLVRATARVAEGDLTCFVNGTKRHDEIGDLTFAFNTMTEKLARSAEQIEEYLQTLEQKVEDRTCELKEANERLKKQDELKSNFLSVAAHELRTPLTSIRAFSELLLDDPEGDVNTRNDFLRIMKEETERLTRLINDILDLSKIEAGKAVWHMKDISIVEVVKSAVDGIKGYIVQQGIFLNVDVPAHLSVITADHDKLVQVVVNLLNNALKFVNHEGRIGVKIYETTQPQAEVITAISNTGHGIPLEKLDSVFERFCQIGNIPTEVKGTGLGLTICKEIVEHLGGRIWVESEIDKKTTFFFSLPVKGAISLTESGFSNPPNND
ncbi:HAMP domain-containing protein, partial [Candidatus Desantisbacteria bacterium]|nr:HAMP domain-containing protein [Candidatus Desantisbacteria bacterium]